MTYWRRRFLALVAGLSVLALVAWAFSGALGASGDRASGSGAGRSGASGNAASGNAASGNAASGNAASGNSTGATAGVGARVTHGRPAAAGAASTGLAGSGHPSGTAGPGAVAPGQPSPSARPSASPGASPSAGAPSEGRKVISVPAQAADAAPGQARACRPGEVVLSLFSSQNGYRPGQVPQFDVDVVSTVGRTCAFNVGAKRLALVIRASGKQVWNSAGCVTGHGRLTTDLTRGVPTIVPISWNLQTSPAGCGGQVRPAQAGRYTAIAADGQLASNPVRFTVG